MLPDEALEALTKATGLVQRERKPDANMFIRSAVISAARGGAGRQAAVLETYLMLGGPKLARGASYAWFSKAFENTMGAVAKRALSYARLQPTDLPGWLSDAVTDWHIVDSMTASLDDALRDAYPGAGDYAALKIHKRYSLGIGTVVDSNFHIDEIQARTPHTVRALVHAAVASSILAALVAHTHRLSEAKPRSGAQRTKAPIHVRTLARTLGALSERISATFRMNETEADAAWKWIVEHIVHYSSDPNWRRSPSLLDQLRGWRIEPGKPNGAGRKPRSKA